VEELLSETIPLLIRLRVISRTPGRMRVRLVSEYREVPVMEQIARVFTSLIQEMDQVRVNPLTGSLTVYYNSAQVEMDEGFALLEEMGILAIAPPPQTNPSTASLRLSSVMGNLNQQVSRFTDGALDLRFLMPLTLTILALHGLGLRSQT